jgi:hypothetical protein
MVEAEMVQVPQALVRTYIHQNTIEFACCIAVYFLLVF